LVIFMLVYVLVITVTAISSLFTAPATTEIYTLSLHDALPICRRPGNVSHAAGLRRTRPERHDRLAEKEHVQGLHGRDEHGDPCRSEEHTSELQSRSDLVCRLLLEKKKKK